MIHRLITYLATAVTNASAFSTVPWTSTKTETLPATTRTRLSLSSSSPSSPSSRVDSVAAIVVDDVTADDVTCYITNDEEIALEGEKPHVVCTSEPEEYAWFNGIETNAMRKTEDVYIEGNENCVFGESYTGKPEWECS